MLMEQKEDFTHMESLLRKGCVKWKIQNRAYNVFWNEDEAFKRVDDTFDLEYTLVQILLG